jgi:hypothetical protein
MMAHPTATRTTERTQQDSADEACDAEEEEEWRIFHPTAPTRTMERTCSRALPRLLERDFLLPRKWRRWCHMVGLDILPLPPIPLAALLQLGGHDFIMESQAHMLPTGSP